MTIPEFLDRLKETPGPWKVYDDGCIRVGDHCPLTAIVAPIDPDNIQGADDWSEAANILGMKFSDAMAVVDAADGEFVDECPEWGLRKQILAATVNR